MYRHQDPQADGMRMRILAQMHPHILCRRGDYNT
jgi:hypothetical protein